MNIVCGFCGAKRFGPEIKSICCGNGQVQLPPIPEAPPPLKQFLKEKSFREKIRGYNQSLAFASLGANEVILPPGVYCFKINGDVHHRVGPLLPDYGDTNPKFAQIYIHDTENEVVNRAQHHGGALDLDVLGQLQGLIHEVNPFAQVFILPFF